MSRTLRKTRLATTLLLLGMNCLSGCASPSSPFDQAIYTGNEGFGLQGYSRTIFSSNNF